MQRMVRVVAGGWQRWEFVDHREGRATGGRAGYGIVLPNDLPVSQRAPHNTATGQSPCSALQSWAPAWRQAAARLISVVIALPGAFADRADRATLGGAAVRWCRTRRPVQRAGSVIIDPSPAPVPDRVQSLSAPHMFKQARCLLHKGDAGFGLWTGLPACLKSALRLVSALRMGCSIPAFWSAFGGPASPAQRAESRCAGERRPVSAPGQGVRGF